MDASRCGRKRRERPSRRYVRRAWCRSEKNNGKDFLILATEYHDSFVAEVTVRARNEWELVEPNEASQPLRMACGDTATYSVSKPPEDAGSGTIECHCYFIQSDHDDGAKDIVVAAGDSVTYRAYKDGASCSSDWTVNGKTVSDTSRIVFNRDWWDVPSWFYPAMDTPKPGVYSIEAHDIRHRELKDSGTMTVVGVKKISGPKGKSSERTTAPKAGSTWLENEVIYVQPCAVFNLTAELEPGLTADEIAKVRSSIEWSIDSGRITPSPADSLVAECCAPADEGTYVVTASCGDAGRVILVKVGSLKIHKVSFIDNTSIRRDDTGVAYSNPAWQDDDLDGMSDMTDANADASKRYQPIAYLSTEKMSATGVFLPACTKVSSRAEFISDFDVTSAVQKVRFAPNNRLFGWDWSAPAVFNKSGSSVTAANPFRDSAEVGYEDEYELAWEVGFGESGTSDDNLSWHRSYSQHELYLTYKTKKASFETAFHISCIGANRQKTDIGVLNGVWSRFADKNVRRKDGIPLTYYLSYINKSFDCNMLLSTHDGQCMAWVDLLLESTCKVHGISARVITCKSRLGNGFCVKNWTFAANGTSGNDLFPYKNTPHPDGYVTESGYKWAGVAEVEYVSGVRGQNNDMPASMFQRHFCVRFDCSDLIYDPSYGLSYRTHTAMDNQMSAYYSYTDGGDFMFAKNPEGTQMEEVSWR